MASSEKDALASHGRRDERYFSSVLFADPGTFHSPNTVFTGVPVGNTTLLPSGNYIPHLSVTNFFGKEVHVHTIFARTSDDAPTTKEVGAFTVPPGSSRGLILRDLEGDPALQNSFIVTSDAAPGALIAKLVSKSDSRLREVELQAKDERDSANAGGHPWLIEQGTESTLLLFNHSKTLQSFTVSVSGSDVWQKTYDLAPMQTKAISIRELIEDQVKDDQGRMLPKARSGELSWSLVDASKGSGRLLQSDRTTGMARNFSCGYSGLLCGSTIQNYESTADDGSIIDYAVITPITCTSGTPNACSGQQTGTGGSFSDYWFSANTAIASLANNSSTSPNSYVAGVSPGTTNINGRVSSSYCSSGGGDPITTVPKVGQVVPSPLVVGTSGPMAIGGVGFSAFKGALTVTVSGSGVSVTNAVVPQGSDDSINATYTVLSNAAVGTRNLVVSSPGVDGGAQVTSNGFAITVAATSPVPGSVLIDTNVKESYSKQTWTSCDMTESMTNQYGYQRCLSYQVVDTKGMDLYENLTVDEAVSVVDPGNISATIHTGNSMSNPSGQFNDDLTIHSATPIPANACTILKQSFTVSGNASAIRVNCLQYSATDVTINDVSLNPAACVKANYHC